MRYNIRKVLTWFLAAVVGAILIGVIGEWFIYVAKDKGLYNDAGKWWDSIMSVVAQAAMSGWVLYPVTCLGGVVAGLWLDTLMRSKVEVSAQPAEPIPPYDAAYLKRLIIETIAIIAENREMNKGVDSGNQRVDQTIVYKLMAIIIYLTKYGVNLQLLARHLGKDNDIIDEILLVSNTLKQILPFVEIGDFKSIEVIAKVAYDNMIRMYEERKRSKSS